MKDKGVELSSESEQERCGEEKTKISSPRRLKSVDISGKRTTQIVYSYKNEKKVCIWTTLSEQWWNQDFDKGEGSSGMAGIP